MRRGPLRGPVLIVRGRGRPGAPLVLVGAFALVVVMTAVGGCRAAAESANVNPDAIPVVATTTILADLVRQVGGDRVRVESLVPKGGEVHTFDPKPSDIRRVTEARLVFRNGLGLDDWLGDLVEDAGTSASVVALAEDLADVEYLGGDEPGEATNPHLWMNVEYASRYAERIADELTALDPPGAATYAANLAAYQDRLAALDDDARTRIGAIPAADRTVVAFHDALAYFAAAYGLTIDGTVVDSPGQEPSARDVALLASRIKDRRIRAIFGEAQFNPVVVEILANETGATVVTDLYTDSVGDAPLDSYEAVMRWNVDRVVEALGR
jgi:ABC-type Zn uptake system ZnuABC Zn-binding protein ZnuA